MTMKMKKKYIIPATEIYHVQLHNVLMLSALDTPANASIPMEVKGMTDFSGVLNSSAWDLE